MLQLGGPALAAPLVAWGIASLAAILLGLVLMRVWDAGFLGSIAATRSGRCDWRVWPAPCAKAFGGGFASLCWGVVFLLLALISFYAGYMLALGYASTALQYNASVFYLLIMPGPAAVFGLGAGFVALWLLGLRSLAR